MWEELDKQHEALVWNVRYHEFLRTEGLPSAKEMLTAWERAHAEEWNRIKPWFAPRLSTESK